MYCHTVAATATATATKTATAAAAAATAAAAETTATTAAAAETTAAAATTATTATAAAVATTTAAVLVVVYHFVSLGAQGVCGASPSDSITRQPLNLTPCFAPFSCFLQNGPFLVCFCFPLLLAPCVFQTNGYFSVDSSPLLRA